METQFNECFPVASMYCDDCYVLLMGKISNTIGKMTPNKHHTWSPLFRVLQIKIQLQLMVRVLSAHKLML